MATHKEKEATKVTKIGIPGVIEKRLNINLTDIHRHRRLSNYLLLLWRHSGIAHSFSPITNGILSTIGSLTFVPAFLQAWTLCRYNELRFISILAIKGHSPFFIKSSKGSLDRQVNPLPVYKIATLRGIDPAAKVLVVSYDKYSHDIKQAQRFINMPDTKNILDKTHIFRHLECTWRKQQGESTKEISGFMGHKSDKTTLKYIHKDWKFTSS
ncbi:hypothetical protein ES705_33506 [subsurface metagenome]